LALAKRRYSMKRRATVYWLIPAEHERELFCEIIRILCREFKAPNFDPHLTILLDPNRQSPTAVLRQIKPGPIRLSLQGVGHSSKFTKTLFVRFKPNRMLERLVVDLSRAAKTRAKPVPEPHVSLVYKKIPAAARKELASAIKMPFREVVFNSIKAIPCNLPVKSRANVEAWRAVATKSLSE
jgi:Cyclic phosphodiesterase-like protein